MGAQEFIGQAFQNILATFVRKPGPYHVLSNIDGHFVSITENLANPPDFLGAILLVRSHSAYWGAARRP